MAGGMSVRVDQDPGKRGSSQSSELFVIKQGVRMEPIRTETQYHAALRVATELIDREPALGYA